MIDQAFEALKTYDWGVDPKVLRPIEDAIVASHGDAKARKDLETRLASALGSDIPQAAKDSVCRSLKTIGTAASVPALGKLLMDEKLSHMARFALQSIPGAEATQALAASLPKAPAKIKVGIAATLGARKTGTPVAPLAALLADKDAAVARSGALALGALGSPEAAKALSSAASEDAGTKEAIADGLLECAENLLAGGKKGEAKAIYEKLLKGKPTDAVKGAATKGVEASS